MTRTFLKIKLKRVFGQTQRIDIDSKSIQEDLAIIQNHPVTLNPPNKSKNQGIHDCSQ